MTTPSNVYHLQRKLRRDEIGPGGDADAGAAAGAGDGADELYVTNNSDNLTEFYQLVKVGTLVTMRRTTRPHHHLLLITHPPIATPNLVHSI